ncbi:MAG: hypothetical protein KBT67_05590 [bacterium]|nr:hypothetical protein [Candidatus Limimorpha caballi]
MKKKLFAIISILILMSHVVYAGTPIRIVKTNYDYTGQKDGIEDEISASIDGHALTIYINENVGIAHIVVTNSNGVYIDRDNIPHTPDMATLLIDDEGLYTVTITS